MNEKKEQEEEKKYNLKIKMNPLLVQTPHQTPNC